MSLPMSDEPSPTPAIRLTDVGLTFSPAGQAPVTALDGISLTVARGEFVAILGPSGCGKSTLLRLIDGLLEPTAGSIHVFDYPMVAPRDDIGFVFQKCTLLPWLNVMDNVLFALRHRQGRITAEQRTAAARWLDIVGLSAFAQARPDALSGGMQQRLGLARALLLDPDILLMDEPFSALDAMTRDEMGLRLMQLWNSHPTTVVFVTHSISEALFLADRIVVMSARPGRIRDIVDVPLARPRGLDTLRDPQFQALANQLRDDYFAFDESAIADRVSSR